MDCIDCGMDRLVIQNKYVTCLKCGRERIIESVGIEEIMQLSFKLPNEEMIKLIDIFSKMKEVHEVIQRGKSQNHLLN